MRAVLLSDAKVSQYLQNNFVLAWNSVRPVPKVTIDFGDGKVLKRTLKGNTAFYICRSNGTVVDSLPGVYEKEDFLRELRDSQELLDLPDDKVIDHHQRLGNPVAQIELAEVAIGKGAVETPVLKALAPSSISTSKAAVQLPLLNSLELQETTPGQSPKKKTASSEWNERIEDVSAKPMASEEYERRYLPGEGSVGERAMKADSQSSLNVLRPAIHKLFAEYKQLPQPEDCRDLIYKEILKVDIDDPYLGLKVEDIPGT